MAERPAPKPKEVLNKNPEAVSPEGQRANEAEQVVFTILNQRAEQIGAQLQSEGRKATTDQEKAYGFFRTLNNLPEKPAEGQGTPKPTNESEDSKNPLKIRIAHRTRSGEKSWEVADKQEGDFKNGLVLTVTSLQYRDGDTVYVTANSIDSQGTQIKGRLYALPATDLAMAQLHSESAALLNDTELTTEQRALLKLEDTAFAKGRETLRDPQTADTIAEGARSSGMISRTSLERFAGSRVSKEKMDQILEGKNIAGHNQTLEIMDAAGLFDKNQAERVLQDAKKNVASLETQLTTAEATQASLAIFEGKAVGEKIDVDGTERDVTQADLDKLNAANMELMRIQTELLEAQEELLELEQLKTVKGDADMRSEMKTYLYKIQKGQVPPEAARMFVTALENNDKDGMYKGIVEEKLSKIKEKGARDAKRKELDEKYEKFKKRGLAVGGVALMLIMMLMKDSAK